MRRLLWPLQPGDFIAEVPGGGRARLRYREALGLEQFLHGGFEIAEIHDLRARLAEGDVVVDVGANVGYLTVAMAIAVGPAGRVIACEPAAEPFVRLRENLSLNQLRNVDAHNVAVGRTDGKVSLAIADDSAFSSTVSRGSARVAQVPSVQLDTLWRQCGSPRVALVKIDVEGAELGVLEGAADLLSTWRPSLLIESEQPASIDEILVRLGYTATKPEGFAPANWLYSAELSAGSTDRRLG